MKKRTVSLGIAMPGNMFSDFAAVKFIAYRLAIDLLKHETVI